MKKLRCDKPYDIDEARKKKGLPRRKRADSRTTAYELTIRIPEEYRTYFGNKRKLTRVVFALNRKDDLKSQIESFEDEKNTELERKQEERGWVRLGERRYLRYVDAVIGSIPICEVTSEDVEGCILKVPELSEKRALERQAAWEENRKTARWAKKHGTLAKPFKPIKVAGPDMQAKVLKFLREVMNYALEKDDISKNVAKAKFLTRLFKKSKPLIDPLMADDAARFLREVEKLPLGYFKVALLLLLNTGIGIGKRYMNFLRSAA